MIKLNFIEVQAIQKVTGIHFKRQMIMKKEPLLFFCFLCCNIIAAQKYVHVIRTSNMYGEYEYSVSREEIGVPTLNYDSLKEAVDLVAIENMDTGEPASYLINISSFQDTIQVIKELLELEGDTRVAATPLLSRSTISSTLYWGSKKPLSIQVYALFVIWGLLYDYQYTAAYSVLRTNIDGERTEETFDGEIVEKAFASYKKWFEDGQGNLNRLRNRKPLVDTRISWLF